MKKIFIFILLAGLIYGQNFKQVKIYINSPDDFKKLNELGLEIDHAYFEKSDKSLWVFVSDKKYQLLQQSGYSFDVVINDWNEYYKNLPTLNEEEKRAALQRSKDEFNVQGFDYGSMGGFLKLNEVYSHLDQMKADFPDIITARQSIGQTLEGRDIYVVKISDNPDVDEDEPEVLYDALTHAREPQGMMTIIYFMYYLLENYGVDPEVTYLVDNRELYFIPVINVDGYLYNQTISPSGGGMWRKNRRVNSDGSRGVDLNRNFGFQWGYDDIGSSPTPSSETYRGTAPFSEPTTQAIRDFCESRHFVNALNYHTYSNLLILPWGYIPQETPDSLIFRQFGRDMTAVNNYTWGISSDIIYSVNGDTDDWMYGEQTTKNKILSMTPEVGSGADGFWPPQSRILPLAMENVQMNLYLAWAAGGFVGLVGTQFSQSAFNPNDTFTASFTVRNKGLGEATNLDFYVESASPYLSVSDNVVHLNSLSSQQTEDIVDAFSITLSEDAPIGENLKFVLVTSSSGTVMSKDTVSIYVGTPLSLFFDGCENVSNGWTSESNVTPKWTETNNEFYSSPSSFTDSKNGNYVSDTDTKLTMSGTIDLTGIPFPKLSFWTKFDIESGWDYGQVLISTNNGSSWTPLQGMYTKPGSGYFQPSGQPVYDGNSGGWVREEIDLSQYSGKQIKIRFQLLSDSYFERDGWYVDDIRVFYYSSIPVELTAFTAVPVEKGVLLKWSTATESNNLGFELQNSKDKANWKTFAFIEGSGTSTEKHEYSFLDNMPFDETSFYRLVQIDYDGSRNVYDEVEVFFSGNMNYELEQNFPNPFNPATVIKFRLKEKGKALLRVFDALGREVKLLVNEVKEAGTYSVRFNADELPSGIYYYQLNVNGYISTRKMLLLK